ncbi:MAG: Ankyrin repeat, partial [Pseudomonadota bacterium]
MKSKQFLQVAAAALLLSGAVVLAQDAEAPWNAVRQDNGRAMAQLVARGTDPNLVNAQGDTLLIAALRDGAGSVVEALLGAPGLRADQANAIGETPLMIAALRGDGGA